MDSVTANGPTEYSGTCGQASQLLDHSRPSHQHGPDTPVLSSYPRTSSSITAKDPTEYSGIYGQASLPMSNATVMDSVTINGPTEYSGTCGQSSPHMSTATVIDSINTNGPTKYSGTSGEASKFLDRSFVPAPTDVSATGSATSSEKASSSRGNTSSSSSTSASEAGPSSNSAKSFASAASFGSVSSSAYSTISAGQGPLNLSGLGLSASGAACLRYQPFRSPARRNTEQFGIYSTSIYANYSNHGAISGEYGEAGPADVAIERLRAIVNNVVTTPDVIPGAFVSDTVVESNERLRIMMTGIVGRYSFGNEDEDVEYYTQSEYFDGEEEEEDRNEHELQYHGHEGGEQEHHGGEREYIDDGEEEHYDGEQEYLGNVQEHPADGEQERPDAEQENPLQEEGEQEHPVQEAGEEEHLQQVDDEKDHSEKVHAEKELPEKEIEDQEHSEEVDGEMEHFEQVYGEKELTGQEPEAQEHSEQVDGGKELPKQEPEEKEHDEQYYSEEHHDGDDGNGSSLTSNNYFNVEVNGHPRPAARPQTPLDFSGLAFRKHISGTVREYEISYMQEFSPIELGDAMSTLSDLNNCTTTRPRAQQLTDIDYTKDNYTNRNTHSRRNKLSNTSTSTSRPRDSEIGVKREKQLQKKTLKNKTVEKIKNDYDKAEKIVGAAMRKVKKITKTGKAMAARLIKRV
ncbi:hypothetical protein RUND412_005487 [Rhizina undulata]